MDPDLKREIEAHIQIEADRLIAQGLSPEQAQAAARRAFGNQTSTIERVYEQSRWMPFERLLQDLRHALRGFARQPGFTALVLLLLTLGIGANTAIFSVMDAVLLKTLPVRDPQDLFVVMTPDGSVSYPVYRDLHDPQQSLDGFFASSGETPVFRVRFPGSRLTAPPKMTVSMVSGGYFDVLGVQPALGRFFAAAEDVVFGGHPVAVVSHNFWRTQMRSDPAAVGASIVLNDTPFTIAGVAPRGFFGESVGVNIDLWAPLSMQTAFAGDALQDRNWSWLKMFGRRRPGVPLQKAEAELTTLFAASKQKEPGFKKDRLQPVRLLPGAKGWWGIPRLLEKPLTLMMAMVGLVLLIASSNAANLMLARGAARRREMGVRLALGCGRLRLVRQMMTESLLLAGLGGLLGLLVAQWGIRFVDFLLASAQEPMTVEVTLDWRVLGFTAAATLLTGVFFGLAPALRAAATPVLSSLHAAGTRTLAGGRMWFNRGLVVAQIVFSLVVLVTAALLVRSMRNLENVYTGLDRDRVLVFAVNEFIIPNAQKLFPPDRLRNLQQRMEAIPGVRSASFSWLGIMSGAQMITAVTLASDPPGSKPHTVRFQRISPGYFRTVGTSLLLGRDFSPNDAGPAAQLVILSESAARKLFGEGPVLGKRFARHHVYDPERELEVIGVVAEARIDGLRQDAPPLMYVPILGSGGNFLSAEFRITASPSSVIPAIRRLFAEEKILVREVRTLAEQADRTIALEVMLASLATVFGLLALIVSATGLYGLLAYATTRRTAEFGVRMAFGAKRTQIVTGVLAEAGRLAIIGLALGLPVALAAARLTRTTLYGLEPNDPLTLAFAAALLLGVAMLAGALPAWRASRVDPAAALRNE
jgi:predicted permease